MTSPTVPHSLLFAYVMFSLVSPDTSATFYQPPLVFLCTWKFSLCPFSLSLHTHLATSLLLIPGSRKIISWTSCLWTHHSKSLFLKLLNFYVLLWKNLWSKLFFKECGTNADRERIRYNSYSLILRHLGGTNQY